MGILETITTIRINIILKIIILIGTLCTLIYRVQFVITGRTNLRESKFTNYIEKLNFLNLTRLAPLLLGRILAGFYYTQFVYNDIFILDISIINKYIIRLLIFISFTRAANLKKNYLLLRSIILIFKFKYRLIFLSLISTSFKKFLKFRYLMLLDFK